MDSVMPILVYHFTVPLKNFTAIDKECFVRLYTILFRSSHHRCFIKKTVLKNFTTFTGKHLWL